MSDKVIIRSARIGDAESVRKINIDAFDYHYGIRETTGAFRDILTKAHIKIFIAEINGEVVGYIHGSDYCTTYSPPLKNILALGVLREHRGKGIGRLLTEKLEQWAKDDGCAGMRLVSGFNRAEAHKFYLKIGYTDRKDQKNFIKMF